MELYYFSNLFQQFYYFLQFLLFICLYNLVKKKTPQNIVIGGAAGALPPVIGWTIATNSLSFEPITFFDYFYWTPSHFWALSLYKSRDYEKAKIPMLPITNGIEVAKKDKFKLYINLFFYIFMLLYYNYICHIYIKKI